MSFYEVWKEIKSGFFPSKPDPIGEETMLNALKTLFKKEVALIQTCKLSAMVINILNEFNADMLKDGNSRDAAIDCVIKLLEDEKTQKPSA